MFFQQEIWMPLQERSGDKHPAAWLAAAFATLAFTWDAQYTIPLRSNRKPSFCWKVGMYPDPRFSDWIKNGGPASQALLRMFKTGELDRADANHPFIACYAAIQNYIQIWKELRAGKSELMTVRRGTSGFYMATPAAERFKSADVSSNGACEILANVANIDLAAALITVGFRCAWSLTRWSDGGAVALRFEPEAFDGTRFSDAVRTARAIQEDQDEAARQTHKVSGGLTPHEAPLPNDHPFRLAYNAILNFKRMEQEKAAIIKHKATLFLQADDHPTRSALVGQAEFEEDRDLIRNHLRGRL